MSMVFLPARLRLPGLAPSETLHGVHRDGVWIGDTADDGNLAAFRCELNDEETDLLVDLDAHPYPEVSMDGSVGCLPGNAMYAGRPVYGLAGWIIYFSALEDAWILVRGIQPKEPRAWKPAGGAWQGDGWYLLGGFDPASPGCSVTAEPRGAYEDDPPLDHLPNLEVKWPRWCPDVGSSEFPCGVWRAQDGATPDVLTIGLLRFVDGDGRAWAERDDGSLAGAGIVLSARPGGVLASEGYRSASSWYQCGSMPGRGGGTVVMYHLESGNPVPVAGEPPIVLSYVGYGFSDASKEIMLAEVALWR